MERLARERRPVVVPYPILWESHGLVVRRLGVARAVSWLKEVQGNALLVAPTNDDYAIALRRPLRYREHPISLFDAILAVMSDRVARPVWTLDHHFDVMGSAVWR